MPFTDTWTALQSQLVVGTTVPNWTADHGLIGEDFRISEVSQTRVTVDPPGAKTPQSVPVEHFELIYERWNDYRHGSFARSKFKPDTRYSKYIISIFHWLEGISGGKLP